MPTEITDDDRVVAQFATWVACYLIGFGVFVIALVRGLPWPLALWLFYSVNTGLIRFVRPGNPFGAPVSRETGRDG